MIWLLNFCVAATAFVVLFIGEAPEQIQNHSWTDAELDRMTPENRRVLLGGEET